MLTGTGALSVLCSTPYLAQLRFRNDPLVEYEFEEIRAAIQFDKEIAANVGWSSLFKTLETGVGSGS